MIERIFDPLALVVMGGCGVAGAVTGLIVAGVRGRSAAIAVEAGLLTVAGAFLARTFVSILLDLGGNTQAAGIAVGWGFFLWPGAVDSVAAIFGKQLLTTPDVLLWIALAVGAVCGLFDGIYRVRSSNPGGVASFILDTTWGLAGTTNADLVHLVDTFAGSHQPDGRRNHHRYEDGFRIQAGYAFTQGHVSSELSSGPGTPLYFHEHTHVQQNRIFGPFFTLSYIAWMVLLFIPSLIAGAIRAIPIGNAIQAWTYFNNPWETWAYRVGQSHGAGARTAFGPMIWSDLVVAIVAVFFVAGVAVVAALVIASVWA